MEKDDMKIQYKLILLLILSVALAGCVNVKTINTSQTNESVLVKSIENRGPILTKEDFPDFKLTSQNYAITPTNLSISLDTESVHGAYVINAAEPIPQGFRVVADSEVYNSLNNGSDQRYILVQYKVYDIDTKLNESMDLTVNQYTQNGFTTRALKNFYSDKRVFVLENGVSNQNVSINKNMNVTIILFGYGSVVGKIGVEDTKDKSLNESLKILNIVSDRLNIKTEKVEAQKMGSAHSPQ